jgi:hypothetical protein
VIRDFVPSTAATSRCRLGSAQEVRVVFFGSVTVAFPARVARAAPLRAAARVACVCRPVRPACSAISKGLLPPDAADDSLSPAGELVVAVAGLTEFDAGEGLSPFRQCLHVAA